MQACPRVTPTALSHCAWHLLWPAGELGMGGRGGRAGTWAINQPEDEVAGRSLCSEHVPRAWTWAGMQSLRTHYSGYFPSLYEDLWFSGPITPFPAVLVLAVVPTGRVPHPRPASRPGDVVQWDSKGAWLRIILLYWEMALTLQIVTLQVMRRHTSVCCNRDMWPAGTHTSIRALVTSIYVFLDLEVTILNINCQFKSWNK
jgi:hypothetical protein